MSWLDTLRPASFRGLGFFVEAADKSFGPRVIVHEVAQGDEPWHEFNGSIPQEITLEAVLLGDDSAAQAVAFEAALAEKSTGRLVHPIYGEIDVVVIPPVRSRFSTAEGRLHRFAITFQCAGTEAQPVATVDTAAAVDRAGISALSAALDDFAARFSPASGASFVADDAASFLRDMAAIVARRFRVAGLGGTGAAAALPGGGIETIFNVTASTIPAPRALGSLLLSIFDLPSPTSPPPAAFTRALLDLGGTSGLGSQATPAPQTTPSRIIAAANHTAVITLMRTGAAVNAVRAASLTGWTSRDEALTWRDSAAEALSDISERISDSEGDGWRKVIDLRAAMVRDVTTRAAPLPRLYSVRPAQTISATLLAYQLDGDAASTLFARADDIVARNKIRHPAFVAGGTDIEVLK